jgi:uncharacterized protein involved in type VI secretion and phage assembly
LSSEPKRFFGKYRGTVTDNNDPSSLCRVKAKVPAVLQDEETGWALPCSPYAGDGVGFFFVPPVGANIWVEFEGGDLNHPIWTGCFWGSGQVPASLATAQTKTIKTDTATVTLNDISGASGVTIETTSGLKIKMDSAGIELSNGSSKVKLTVASVSINDGALEVT